jgi:hypothetical protein
MILAICGLVWLCPFPESVNLSGAPLGGFY